MVKKITLVGTLPPIKGVSDYCIEQTRSLSEHTQVEFYNFKNIYPEFLYKGGSTKENDPVFKRPSNKNIVVKDTLAWYNPFSWFAAGFFSKGEILHFHWWTFYLFPIFFTIAFIAKLRGKKIVCTIHNVIGHESGSADKFLSGVIFLVPHKFIVHTKNNKQQLQDFFKVPENKIEIIPHGIYDFYRDKELTKREAREKNDIPEKAKVLLCFGNIRPYKGIEDLIEAFKIVREKNKDIYLVIVGKPWNEELQNKIEQSLFGIPEKLLYFDYVASSDIKNFFFAADVVVLPYRDFAAQSGPGNIALAFEKPLIVSNVGGLPDLVLNKGLIFDAGNTKKLAELITLVFSKKRLLEEFSRDSAKLKQKYSWESIAQQTLKIYNEFLE
ncbi:MAG TPA: glycosyltransferase family 4 protein [archaeon]|nr:glycosyltransferase family 4 protein [archaeon]